MPEYDEATLERIMRDGLEFRAGSAETQLAGPPGAGHVVRRGRRRWVPLAAAAAVVVAGVAAFAALHGSGDDGQAGVVAGQVPSDWRYESYDGVQVRVPPTWGWGGEPTGSGDQLTRCGEPTAVVVPDTIGSEPVDGRPFVGRPVMMSDACQGGLHGPALWPQVSAVWLGSPLPVGQDTSGGRTAATIAVGSQHVTVFSGDDALRAEILSTAEAVTVDGNGCPSAPVDSAVPGPTDDASPDGLSVCVYDQGHLLWSTTKDAGPAQRYVTAFQQTSAVYDFAKACPPKPSDQWVAIGVGYAGASTRWDVADFGCDSLVGSYTVGSGGTSAMEAPLVPDTVEPWAGGGIKAYVVGPGVTSADDPLTPYFKGVMG